MDSIGERIKYLRKEVLIKTQKDFGSRIGLKPNSVSDIESGKNNPTEQTINSICREFGVSKLWLSDGNEPIFFDADSRVQIDNIMNGENEFAKNLFKEFAKLDDDQWKMLESLIKSIARELE